MEPQTLPQKESFSIALMIINLVGGALTGVVTAAWFVAGFKARQEANEEKTRILTNVVFREKGGLSFMSPEEHTVVCLANQEIFGKDFELMAKDIAHMKETLTKIEHNIGAEDLAEMRRLMESINGKLGTMHDVDASRRVGVKK